MTTDNRTNEPTPEQILVDEWIRQADRAKSMTGMDAIWFPDAEETLAVLRANGLLSDGAPSEEQARAIRKLDNVQAILAGAQASVTDAVRELSLTSAALTAAGVARPVNGFDTTAERVKNGADSVHVATQEPCPQPCEHLSAKDAREGRDCQEHPCICPTAPTSDREKLVEELRAYATALRASVHVPHTGADLIERGADALAARQPGEDDREAKAEALKEWQSSNEIRRYSEFYTSWEDGYDAGFSRAAVPDAQAERVSMEVLDEYLRIAAWLETQAALRGATGDTMHGLAAEALATLIDHEYSRHTIPLYGMLDVWMALHGTSHPDFDEFYDEHGYAEAWSRLMAEIRSRAAVPDAATDARERLHAKCDCVPDLGPAHCHLCSADGSPVEWANCVAVQQVTDAPETVEVAFKTVEVERLGHLLVQLSPATPRNGAATVRRLMEEMNIKEVVS